MQKKYRLTNSRSFNYLYKKGRSVSTKQLVLIYAPSKFSLRVGFVVSKKNGKAVVRNKVRRRMKEAFRSFISEVCDNYNYIVLARVGIEELSYAQIRASIYKLLKQNNLLKTV